MRSEIHGVYAITPDGLDPDRLLASSRAALHGGVRWLQYRDKSGDALLRRHQAVELRALTRDYGAALIINDDLPLALTVDADGVHLGRDDGCLAAARAALGPQRLLGASCYASSGLAQAAVAAGASYVALGAVFASTTKPGAVVCPLQRIRECRAWGVPVVAIGGITVSNAEAVIAAGADVLAVSAALFAATDVTAAARALCAICARSIEKR